MTNTVQEIHFSDVQHEDILREADKNYLKCVRRLLIKKENEIACADRTRKMQIRDVTQHYQFELRRVEAQFRDDVEECRNRLQSTQNRGQKREHLEIAQVTPNLSNQSRIAKAMPPKTSNLMRYSTSSDTTALQLGLESISEDISEASKNFRIVTNSFSRSLPQKQIVVVDTDSGALIIGGETFRVGDMIRCFSNLSQEAFHGVISNISNVIVDMMCGNFARFSFRIDQIKEGRVVISRDVESIQNLEILEKCRQEPLK